jgi:cephalosporin hydroxylase
MTHLDVKSAHSGLGRSLYRGVSIQKFPFDYLMYQMIIHEMRPDLIIEIGTMHGGAALYYADLMDTFGIEGGEVHTIDIVDPYGRKKHEAELEDHKPNPNEDPNYPDVVDAHPRIKTFTGGYQSYDLSNCKGFKRVLVIDDGSHVYDDVKAVMYKFKHLTPIGGYFIIEDGNAIDVCPKPELVELYEGGPLRAIFEFLALNDEFRVAYRWCDMFGTNSTFNTYGYLQKVK